MADCFGFTPPLPNTNRNEELTEHINNAGPGISVVILTGINLNSIRKGLLERGVEWHQFPVTCVCECFDNSELQPDFYYREL